MGGRVYDPIHDVFQETRPTAVSELAAVQIQTTNTTVNTNSPSTPVEIHTTDGGVTEKPEDEISSPTKEQESDNESTQSDDKPVQGNETDPDADHHENEVAIKKKSNNNKESSKYTRHLKKPDGSYFTRKDIQYKFLSLLLSDKREIFTNVFYGKYLTSLVPLRDVYDRDGSVTILNVNNDEFDARRFISHEKLTFSQMYLLSLATSSKCSKVLRDKLLLDHQVAFCICVLSLLVNIGRLNTTINFYLEMTSQLRTFHSVPSLQCKNTDPKTLQDTPRLKSILKNLPFGNFAINLSFSYNEENTDIEKCNIINYIFAMCEHSALINAKFLNEQYIDFVDSKNTSGEAVVRGNCLFDILDTSYYKPEDRCNVFIWLLYIHLETNITEMDIKNSLKLFGKRVPDSEEYRIRLERNYEDYDIDTPEEIQYGEEQYLKRKEFLKKLYPDMAIDDDNSNNSTESSTTLNGSVKDENQNEALIGTPTPVIQEPKKRRRRRRKAEIMEAAAATAAAAAVTNGTGSTVESVNNSPIKSVDSKNGTNHSASNSATINENLSQIDKLIQKDRDKKIEYNDKTQHDFLTDLKLSHEPIRRKRNELGLIKIFNEFEDIPMASVIGIRGKKRKKFKDGLLGFETDYLRTFSKSKDVLLSKLKEQKENKNTVDNNCSIFKI